MVTVPRRRRRAATVLVWCAATAASVALHADDGAWRGAIGAQGRPGTAAPAPSANDTAAFTADTALLMRRLRALSDDSMQGRAAGTAGGVRARAWLAGELAALQPRGLEPLGAATPGLPAPAGDFARPVRVRFQPGSDSVGANLVARIRGRERRPDGPVLVLSAHYDHVGVRRGAIHNGADDNASGTVALLAVAEYLLREPPRHDVILAWFDAEEQGLLGAKAFVAAPPVPLERIAVAVNLDMVARQDGGAIWVAGLSHWPALRPVAERVATDAPVTVRFGHDTPADGAANDWTGQSDHAAFHRAGVPFLYLGVEDHPDYHRPGDDWDRIDPTFYAGVVAFAGRLVRALDESPALLSATRSRE